MRIPNLTCVPFHSGTVSLITIQGLLALKGLGIDGSFNHGSITSRRLKTTSDFIPSGSKYLCLICPDKIPSRNHPFRSQQSFQLLRKQWANDFGPTSGQSDAGGRDKPPLLRLPQETTVAKPKLFAMMMDLFGARGSVWIFADWWFHNFFCL